MSNLPIFHHGPSRRDILHQAGGLVLAAGAFLIGSARQAAAKMTKKAALYRDKPKENAKCSTCEHFQPPAACEIVAGKISPNGWCQMYIKKS